MRTASLCFRDCEILKRWENLGLNRLYFQYARMTCDESNRPGGADIIVQIARFEDDGVTNASIFASGNRLRIQDGEWRSAVVVQGRG